MVDMKRFLGMVAAVLAMAAGAAHAQAGGQKPPRVAYVWLFNAGPSAPYEEAFRKGMAERGWIEGKTVRIESYDANGDVAKLDGIMAQLVRSKVDVIVAMCTPEAKAALRATTTVPIVVTAGGDLIAAGIVKSYNKPGANVTGFSLNELTVPAKRVELLKEALPAVRRATILWNPTRPDNASEVAIMVDAAKRLGLQARSVQVRTREELATALEMLAVDGTDALLNAGDPLLSLEAPKVARRAAELKIPSMFTEPVFIENGGLMYFGPDMYQINRSAASYVDRILKGAKPGDLPIQIPSHFDLGINRKAAKEMGVRIPEQFVLRAVAVID